MAAVQQGHHFPPFHRSIRKAPCISPPRLRCKEPTPNLTGGGSGIIPSPSGKYKEEFNLNERDQLLVKIRFFADMMDCRKLHMLLGFARGLVRVQEKEGEAHNV